MDDLYGEPWMERKPQPKGLSPGVGLLLVAVCLLLMMFLPGGESSGQTISYQPPVPMSERILNAIPGRPSIAIREDFRLGLRNWMGAGEESGGKDGWDYAGGAMRLGGLRLWKPTLQMSDYQFNFEGSIERKSLNWTYRATDARNYYATKLTVKSGSKARPEIIRYMVLDGRESKRIRLPIPIEIREGESYVVKVRVRGDRFHTVVNGQLVDSWADPSLRAGGVGFYSDTGEKAALRWVSISDREGFFQRFFSLSFLVSPTELMGPLAP